jgi:hypothetical protein
MKRLGIRVVAVGLLMTSAVSMAQDAGGYPDMRGQWKGTSQAVVAGSGPHNRAFAAGIWISGNSKRPEVASVRVRARAAGDCEPLTSARSHHAHATTSAVPEPIRSPD